jgi:lipid-A-disaccharide synthase
MPAAAPLHVFVVAGEVSGDRLGAPLMAALKVRTNGNIRFSGVGGTEMARQGLQSLFPIDATAVMGFADALGRISIYLRRIRQAADAVIAAKPDILVIIDSPEFTHRIAKRVRKRAPSIPIVDYVSPSVWAWRPWRAKAMRAYVDHVMALLPFEPAALQRLKGPPCSFVGHPLSERAEALRPRGDEVARRDSRPYVVVLMPGSRKGELARLLDIFEDAAIRIAAAEPGVEFVMPAAEGYADHLKRAVAAWPVPVRVVSTQDDKDAAFRTARAALVKSGTGTLELAISGVPMVVGYRVGGLEGVLVRPFISVGTVVLANLVLSENVVPEFLQADATAEKLAAATLDVLRDGPQRRRQLDAFNRLDEVMEIKTARPSERAADIVLALARRRA